MKSWNRAAFTLVELVMVIVIIGLLAAVVTPKFTSMRTEAQSAAEEASLAAIQTGIKLFHMSELAKGNDTYPASLDSAAIGVATTTNPLFTEVIENGLTDSNWEKLNGTVYRYKPTGTKYKYTKSTGTFAPK